MILLPDSRASNASIAAISGYSLSPARLATSVQLAISDARDPLANGSPTTNRISTGSTGRGIPEILIQQVSTSVIDGKHPKSIWKTLPCRNSGFNKGAATPQIPTEASDNRILDLD